MMVDNMVLALQLPVEHVLVDLFGQFGIVYIIGHLVCSDTYITLHIA